jgi:hypothetical protein
MAHVGAREWRDRGGAGAVRSVSAVTATTLLAARKSMRKIQRHDLYNIFMLTLYQRMCNVIKGRHGLRAKAKPGGAIRVGLWRPTASPPARVWLALPAEVRWWRNPQTDSRVVSVGYHRPVEHAPA